MIPVFDADAVTAAVSPAQAIPLVTDAFEAHGRGEWVMPPKVYMDAGEAALEGSGAAGDFRAMPARGDGLAMLKWVTSFPGNPKRDLPVVAGALILSSAESGELLAIMDCASITSLRTGAAAAVSARVLAREDAKTVGVIGCGVNGATAARCLAAAGYGPGLCSDLNAGNAQALADELDWGVASREVTATQDVVVTVTPGDVPVILDGDLRPGQHIAVLGADAHDKAEVERAALSQCRLFCDEWEQASGGGELSGPVEAGEVTRENVTELGSVMTGLAPGRQSSMEITLFDSTGLAIQDLAIARAVLAAWRAGRVEAQEVRL
ncbi:MAG: ornithine cyclodeaminase family protein [Solirubrobacterales bacterium]